MRAAVSFLVTVAAIVVLAFLLLPLVALFLRTPPATLLDQLGSEAARDALRVSLKTSALAHVLILALGTPAAYLLATRRFRGRALVLTAIELPLVLPPAVAGIALLVAFGRNGLLPTSIALTQTAVVLAVAFVAGPFYVRGAVAAFEAIDRTLVDASRTLGAGPLRAFATVVVPLAGGGLGAASTLAFARGLGEFGATIIFAGSFAGETQTLPLAIYAQLDDPDVAVAIGAMLVVVSAAILVTVKLIAPWTRSRLDSPIPFAASGSTST
jgi:molybdate transport system permease protein